MQAFISKLLSKTFILFFSLVSLLTLVLFVAAQIIDFNTTANEKVINIIVGIICAIVIVVLLCLLGICISRISKKIWICCIIFALAVIPRLVLLFYTHPVPFSDFADYYNNALQWAEGSLHGVIYQNFPDLIGFVKWESILISIFGTSYFTLQMINCVIVSLLCVMIFLLFSKINVRVGVLAAVLYAFYPSHILGSAILTNQHLFSLLCYSAVYVLLIKTDSYHKKAVAFVVSGVLIGFAQIIRPEGPTVLIAVMIFMIYLVIVNRKSLKTIVMQLLLPCFLAVAYFAVTMAFSLYLYGTGLTEKPFASTDLRYKLCVGLNIYTFGSYSDIISEDFFKGNDQERSEMLKNEIKYYADNPNMLLLLAATKVGTQYALIDSSYFFLLNNKEPNAFKELKTWNDRLSQPFYLCILLLGLYAFWKKRGSIFSDMELLLLIMVLVRLGVYLLIEVQPRYRLFDMPVFFYFAALGIYELSRKYFKSGSRKKPFANQKEDGHLSK